MKRIITLTIILTALTACASPQSPAGLPNPASVYCEQNGNTLEIVTAADGSQSGQCIFPDGSACDEWAYYRGECGPAVIESATDASGGGAGTEPPAVTCRPMLQNKSWIGGASLKARDPAHNLMITLSGRIWSRSSTSGSIQWIRQSNPKLKRCVTAARLCIFTAHWSAMYQTITARRFW